MGKGEGDDTLPQRGRGQDAVRRAAAARPHQRAARVAPASAPAQRSVAQGLQSVAVALVALAGAVIVAIAEFPDQVGRSCRRSRNCCRRRCRTAAGRRRRIGSTRTGRPRIGTGSTMRARAPRPSRCPMPGFSRWNSRAFICSRDPACCGHASTSNGSVSSQVRNPSTSTKRACAALAMCIRPAPRPSRRRRPSPACSRRRSRISTACRSVSRE